jgi:hypothetical protein
MPSGRKSQREPENLPDAKKLRLAQSVDDRLRYLESADFVREGGLEVIGSWMTDAVSSNENALLHATLDCLEKIPMTLDLLQSSKIGKIVNESLKPCSDETVVARGRTLITSWKQVVSAPKPKEPESPVAEAPKGDSAAVDALASLLDSLPDLEALISAQEADDGKRRIKWRPDDELVQMVEFAIMETCEDLRRRIDETHGGRMALHPHGQDTVEEARRFQEFRKKERAMGGNRLRMHLSEEDLMDEYGIQVTIPVWVWPAKIKVLTPEAVFDAKKLRSYERQDLADLHGSRPETVYASDADVPDNPSEPSSVSGFKLQQNVTVDVALGTGAEEPIDLEPTAPPPAAPTPSVPVAEATFDDEFVKLDAKLQTKILGSEELLNLFTREPVLLRGLTGEKLDSILSEFKNQTPSIPHTVVDDRKSWGASTIRTAVRNEVMSSFTPLAPQPPPPSQFMNFPHMPPPPPVMPGRRSPPGEFLEPGLRGVPHQPGHLGPQFARIGHIPDPNFQQRSAYPLPRGEPARPEFGHGTGGPPHMELHHGARLPHPPPLPHFPVYMGGPGSRSPGDFHLGSRSPAEHAFPHPGAPPVDFQHGGRVPQAHQHFHGRGYPPHPPDLSGYDRRGPPGPQGNLPYPPRRSPNRYSPPRR